MKTCLERNSQFEIELRDAQELVEKLKKQLKQTEGLNRELEKNYNDICYKSIVEIEKSSNYEQLTKTKLIELTDTTNASRVKILQLLHESDQVSQRNIELESYIVNKDNELLEVRKGLLLKCQHIETLLNKVALQKSMIQVQTDEIVRLRSDMYNLQLEQITHHAKYQDLKIHSLGQNKKSKELCDEISRLKSLSYSLSKSQTDRTLAIKSSPFLKSTNKKSANVTASDVLRVEDRYTNDHESYENTEELDDIYDVISKTNYQQRTIISSPHSPDSSSHRRDLFRDHVSLSSTAKSLPQLAEEMRELKSRSKSTILETKRSNSSTLSQSKNNRDLSSLKDSESRLHNVWNSFEDNGIEMNWDPGDRKQNVRDLKTINITTRRAVTTGNNYQSQPSSDDTMAISNRSFRSSTSMEKSRFIGTGLGLRQI